MNKIIIDALTITFKFDNIANLLEDLNLFDVEMQPSRTKYYSDGQYYSGIKIFWNMDDHYQVTDTMLDLSGTGCRTVEQLNPSFDWFAFLHKYDNQIRNREVHISRIDIACDVDDGSIPIDLVQKYSRAELYVCKSKVLPDVRYMRTEEVYFGSPRSDRLLRIYNKALEMCLEGVDWTRFEFQLRNDNAVSFYLNWCNNRDIGSLYAGVMIDFLRFVQPPKGASIKEIKQNRHQGRLPTAKWWEDFIGTAKRIPQLYLPGYDYTLAHLEHYLEKQSYSSLKAYMIAHDGDLTKLIDGISKCELNAKQKLMLSELQMMRAEQEGKKME